MDTLRTILQCGKGERPSRKSNKRGIPFSLFIVRYFIYVLVGAFLVAGIVVSLLIVAVDSGTLYPANYASINHEATVGEIEARGTVTADDVPSCYRWGVFDKEGKLIEGDFDARTFDFAEAFLHDGGEDAAVYSSPLGSPVYATRASLENGDTCVLVYDFNPDFASKTLRDTLPDPQGTILVVSAVLFAVMVGTVATRASRVMRRKLSPLVDAASRIGNRELEFDVAHGNVRETNEVLDAIDAMRISLKTSLEKQWASEQAQRESLSSLAHDLKTPLTIVRGNADLLRETKLGREQEASTRFIQEAAGDMESLIDRIIDVTHSSTETHSKPRRLIEARVLCEEVAHEAQALAGAHGSACAVDIGGIPTQAFVQDDGDIAQAVLNLVDNAFAYGKPPITLCCEFRWGKSIDRINASENREHIGWLNIAVQDEGGGFSDAALAHATERFYRDNSARTRDGHYGLGLAIAQERACACGGELLLENTTHGAQAILRLPCIGASFAAVQAENE